MMQRLITLLVCTAFAASAFAQKEAPNDVYKYGQDVVSDSTRNAVPFVQQDSVDYYSLFSPFYDSAFLPLHSGMNAQLSLSTMVGWGSHSPSGVGFGRSVSVIYASPMKNNFSYTLGINTQGINWGGYRYNEASIGGSLNYSANDKLGFSIEGYKDMTTQQTFNRFRPYRPDSYISGAVNYKFSDKVFIQVSVGSSTWTH